MVLADAAHGQVGQFRLGLEQRELADVVQVPAPSAPPPETPFPRSCRTGAAAARQLPATVGSAAGCGSWWVAGERAARTVAWRQGADGRQLALRFVACGPSG